MDYASKKTKIEALYAVYRSIQKTILLVRRMAKDGDCSGREAIKSILSSRGLSRYLSTGVVSPYFVALIPKASVIIHGILDRKCEDGTTLIDFCNRIGIYSQKAIESLSMFYPNAMTKTIVEMCS
jgi:hypothetical protein